MRLPHTNTQLTANMQTEYYNPKSYEKWCDEADYRRDEARDNQWEAKAVILHVTDYIKEQAAKHERMRDALDAKGFMKAGAKNHNKAASLRIMISSLHNLLPELDSEAKRSGRRNANVMASLLIANSDNSTKQ